jgi:L,D-transpeptidase catalytic domain
VKQAYLPLSTICLSATLLFYADVNAGHHAGPGIPHADPVHHFSYAKTSGSPNLSASKNAWLKSSVNFIYEHLGLEGLGLSKAALSYAFKGLQTLSAKGLISNPNILTICDFSQSSHHKRLYILDMLHMRVLKNTYVAHGRNSGLDYAHRFSNRPESLESSLGFFVTGDTYYGKNGLSLRLSGLERGFNDNAESRAIVVHGADYIGADRLDAPYMGRSYGCPAVPEAQAPAIIDLIRGGTCLFIYHPTAKYLKRSKILNA